MPDKYEASIAGIPLAMETIEDGFEKAIAVYEFPYKNGAKLEDMGQKAHRIKVRCYFWEETYDDHITLINTLEKLGIVEFIHPKYGLIKGMICGVAVRHDDKIRTAEVDLDFVEELRGTIEYTMRPDVKSGAESAYEAGIADMKAAVKEKAIAEIGAEAEQLTGRTFSESLPILSQLGSASRTVRQWVKSIDSFVARLENELDGIANPANSLIASIEFGTDLPGRVVGAISRTAERYSLLYDSIKALPEKFTQNMQDALTDLAVRLGYSTEISNGFSLRTGLDLGGIFSEDEDKRDRARSLEKGESFNAQGQYIKAEATPDLLTVSEIEKSLAIACGMLQGALESTRPNQALKDMARLLIDHAVKVKIERERLKAVTIQEETPLHLICVQNGLSYNYAERLVKVNSLQNPNQIKGEILIYVR